MPSYRGKFQYQSQTGAVLQQGACQIQFDDKNFILTPEIGAPLSFDLGDVDAVASADYQIQLPLYTGNTVQLQQFGKAYEDLSRTLIESHRKRMLECLLLEDLQEIDRFTGNFAFDRSGDASISGTAEFRLFKTNLAVLPAAAQAFHVRLAGVDALRFDAQNYEIVLEMSGDRLKLNRLAKRTELFHARLRETIDAMNKESAEALHLILPFLNPDQLQAAAGTLHEGHSASASKLAAIHSRIPDALAANAVDKTLKPYYDDLLGRTAKGFLYAGFKLVRPEDRDRLGGVEEAVSDDADADYTSSAPMSGTDEGPPPALYWFFFPIAAQPGSTTPSNVVAWEASSSSGRATYFFRLLEPAESATLRDPARAAVAVERGVQSINRVLAMLNFRRRPIYLSDDDLSGNPAFQRYPIAARRIPELRRVRAAFLGRAMHSSFEAWQGQVNAILLAARS